MNGPLQSGQFVAMFLPYSRHTLVIFLTIRRLLQLNSLSCVSQTVLSNISKFVHTDNLVIESPHRLYTKKLVTKSMDMSIASKLFMLFDRSVVACSLCVDFSDRTKNNLTTRAVSSRVRTRAVLPSRFYQTRRLGST